MPPPSSSAPSTFAVVLRRQRESAGLTQAELALRAGIGERTVSNLERGINSSPYPSTVRLLADALDLPEDARADLLAAAGRRKADATTPLTGGYLGAMPSTQLVARDAECAAISTALSAAAAGEARVVLLAGEPGIGKTRLAQEASRYAEERGFLVVGGRCYEQQNESPFVPFFEVFRALYDAAPQGVRESIVERWPPVVTLLPDQFPSVEPSVAWTSPDAAELLHRAATGFIREVAQHRPVAVLLDDLHWADDATLELLTHLVRHARTDRMVLLGTYRDAEVDAAHPVRRLVHALHRERMTEAISVGRFDRDTTARLVAQRLDAASVSAELSDLVHRHAEGNPFFTVEIVTALLERGDLALLDGQWVCRELAEVETPAQVSELISERVARLSVAARAVLEAASVLGTVFDPDDVVAGETGEEQLEAILDEATASGLLMIDEGRYAFDHSLTQQALYAGLSPVRRRRLHREVGERLAGRQPAARGRRSAEIARHLESGGLPDRAIPFLLLAGESAAGVYSQGEAIRLFGHAVALAEDVGDETAAATALERLGQVELLTARYDDAVEHLAQAADGYRRTGEIEPRLRVEGMIAEAQHRRGEGEAAAVRLDQVVAELEVRIDSELPTPGVATLGIGLARVRLSLGQHELCVDATERAARLARKEGSVAAEADAYGVGGTALLFLDRPDDAVAVLERAIGLAARADALTVESGATLGLQWWVTMRGEFARARALGDRGLEITRRAANADMESLHAANLGLTFFYSGDWGQAERYLELGAELALGSPTLFSGIPPVYLGVLRAAQGDSAAATACYDEAATAPDLQTFAFAGYLAARRAELDLRADDPVAALARLEPWLDVEAPTRIHDAMLLLPAVEACLELGDLDRGDALAARAARRAAAMRNELDGIDAQRLQGRCLSLQGRPTEARQALDGALARAEAVPYPAAQERIRADLAQLAAR